MRIAIVDGYSTSRFLVEDLNRAGASCVHVRSQEHPPAVYVRAFDARAYDRDLGWFPRPEAAAAALAELGVHRVVAGTESGVLLADRLNELLRLPGNRPESADARRDKPAMARALRAAGLAAAEDVSVSDPDEGVAWFAGRPGGRVVVKPPSSAGSDNVWVCGTAAEVAAACRTVLDAPNFFGEPNGVALVQDYLDGEEYLVNSVSRDGDHRVVEVWRSVRLPGPDGACLYDFQEPLSYDAPGVAAVVSYVRQVLDALGVRNGAGHSELRVTAAGPVLLETGARLCGGVLPDVSLKYAGMSQVRLLTLSLLDPAGFAAFEESAVRWSKAVRWVSLISDRAGGAASDTWREKLRRLETFDGLVSRVSAGGTVARTVDLATSPGFVYLAADSARAVREDYERLRSLEPNGFYLS
ncbi:hypothetical protein BIV25_26035 [Streptomyces sp. MUSC 14]|uniref:ATP-grasp domain-containing protein n=1 Tax=Streptomyces sp. MUSC 14 TaxID=1354889 RepID=UPI0008F55B38|nr:ATP-grasp domain-containing protein [Streptomyces sp. MUSC 14]OIJ93030.1 hypothetical protein BIV25_26035 [Streptomyces sp. MUSC 14]